MNKSHKKKGKGGGGGTISAIKSFLGLNLHNQMTIDRFRQMVKVENYIRISSFTII